MSDTPSMEELIGRLEADATYFHGLAVQWRLQPGGAGFFADRIEQLETRVALLTEVSEAIRRLEAERASWERRAVEARYRPVGDNHHNAIACPYCNPTQLIPAKLLDRALAAEAERDQALAALELAADIRWSELAAGSPFTIIDRQMLGDLHEGAARVLALRGGGLSIPRKPGLGRSHD